MNVFTNTKKLKKLVIILVFLILFNFCYPKTVQALSVQEIKNTILTSVAELFFSIFDGLMQKINSTFMGYDSAGVIYLSPENIIKGKFILTDANIFKTVDKTKYFDTDGAHGSTTQYATEIVDGKTKLRQTILGWYFNLRNLTIVALLSILVYIAIRMILSSVSSDKAKYKMMFKDWLVAMCLVFAMHYIMVGVLGITDTITEAISGGKSTNMAQKEHTEINNRLFNIKYEGEDKSSQEISEELSDLWGHIFIYAAIFTFTLIFTVKYVIRALTITFLILLAPISCITYPIDKLGDGKSQAFDFWFKEFFMEVMIQPFHLLLYMVLIGAAVEMADTNIIYTIICFAIMLPAEKFIKQMFGINEKLGSPLGAFASGAVFSSMAKNAAKILNGGGKKNSGSRGGNESNDSDEQDALPPRQHGSLGDYDDGREDDDNSQQRLTAGNDDEQQGLPVEANNNENNQGDVLNNSPGGAGAADGYLGEGDPKQQALLGMNDNNDSPSEDDTSIESNNDNQLPEEDSVPIQRQPKSVRRMQQARNAIKSEIGKDVRKRFGTTSGKGLLKKAIKATPRTLGKVLNGATRLTLAAGAAGIMGMAALATGNSKAIMGAIGAGAVLGNAAGKRINGVRTNINGRVGRYYQAGKQAFKGEDKVRKQAKQKYIQNQKERDYVAQYLRDKNGYIPSGKEINDEMEKRWDYQESGITDRNIIDGSRNLAQAKEEQFLNNTYTNEQKETYNDVESRLKNDDKYEQAYEQLRNGDITTDDFNQKFGAGEAEKAREHQAMESTVARQRSIYEKQALFSASIANGTSKSDFSDRKKMENMRESYINDYMKECKALNKPMTRERAERTVDAAINDAARIKGIPSGANLPVRERPPVREQQQPTPQQPTPQRPTPQQEQQTPTDRNTNRRTERRNSNRNNPPRSQRVAERRASSQRRNNDHTNDQNIEQETENNNQRRVGRVTDSQGRSSEVRRGRRSNSSSTGSNHVDSTQPNPHTGPGSNPTPTSHT